MALFGKKKSDADAPAASDTSWGAEPQPAPSGAGMGVFDFDAIAKDLGSENGASPFDALLSAPARPASSDFSALANSDIVLPSSINANISPQNGAVVDFPATAGSSKAPPSLDDLEALSGAPNPMPVATSGTATAISPVAVSVPPTSQPLSLSTKKPLLFLPVLGALGMLVLVGGGGYLLSQGANKPAVDTVGSAASGSAASDGVLVKAQNGAPRRVSQQSATPSGSANIDRETLTLLKNLWEQGKAAKQAGDYDAARRFWSQALAIRPHHPGFQESINQLPPVTAQAARVGAR